jgi:hypothetical protein
MYSERSLRQINSIIIADYSQRNQRCQYAERISHLFDLHLETFRLANDCENSPQTVKTASRPYEAHLLQAGPRHQPHQRRVRPAKKSATAQQ